MEVTAAQQDHLVQWLSKRLNRPLKVPALAPRVMNWWAAGCCQANRCGAPVHVPERHRPAHHAVFGSPYTCHDSPDEEQQGPCVAASTADADDHGLQFTQEGLVPGFLLDRRRFGYALSGQLTRTELLELATAVYPQLQP